MKIAVGSDHGGFKLKPVVIETIEKLGAECYDFGCYDGSSVDYVDYAKKVADAVLSGEYDLGILICGTGIGMSIAANKFKGIRCAHCEDVYSAKMTRLHNDANILAIGERVTGAGLAEEIVKAFIETPFSKDERHIKRIEKIREIEDENFK